ncbi:MAG: magnesium transporter, partial [Planctomycetia bacterium]|nr:magnesium transporter [Planctomycetia bacterium]
AFLPLLFQRLGWDPALMSNPFVAGISDTVGTLIYMLLAFVLVCHFHW